MLDLAKEGLVEAVRNKGFRVELLALAGNTRPVEVVRDLRDRARLLRVPALAESGELPPSAREHVELVDLLTGGHAAEAETPMRRHLAQVRGAWAQPR